MTPYNGLANRTSSNVTNCKDKTSKDTPSNLGLILGAAASETMGDYPEFAQVAASWPALPQAVRSGILAMVNAVVQRECPNQ